MSYSDGNDISDEDDLEVIEEPEAVGIQETPTEDNGNVIEDQAITEGASTNDTDANKKVKRVRNPQPKLDAERLRGPRGLVALEGIFKDVKFKGHKHEEEDLNLLMKTYEYWCHRLFPKFPFDSCLERLEKLGTSKLVQSYIRKIRMDLVDDEAPIVDSDDDDDNNGDVANDQPIVLNNNPNIRDDFDVLLTPLASQLTQSNNDEDGELTEEQLERIRLNREKAKQRRTQMVIHNSQLSQETSATIHDSDATVDLNFSRNNIMDSETTGDVSSNQRFSTKSSRVSTNNLELPDDSASEDIVETLTSNSFSSHVNLEYSDVNYSHDIDDPVDQNLSNSAPSDHSDLMSIDSSQKSSKGFSNDMNSHVNPTTPIKLVDQNISSNKDIGSKLSRNCSSNQVLSSHSHKKRSLTTSSLDVANDLELADYLTDTSSVNQDNHTDATLSQSSESSINRNCLLFRSDSLNNSQPDDISSNSDLTSISTLSNAYNYTTNNSHKQVLSQESESLPTCMSAESENCNQFSFPVDVEIEGHTRENVRFADSVEKSRDLVMNHCDLMSIGSSQKSSQGFSNDINSHVNPTTSINLVEESHVAISQESETLQTCMSFESEKCFASSQEMIVSEVDSPMDVDSI